MRLIKFQVKDFRSVEESGWLTVDDVTALIGVNESGKTNLLLPLWKLNPAREGEIEPTSDYPKVKFGEIRDAPGDYWFIEADFVAGAAASKISRLANIAISEDSIIRVTRYFDGDYYVEFPEHGFATTVPTEQLSASFDGHRKAIQAATPLKSEEAFAAEWSRAIEEIDGGLVGSEEVGPQALVGMRDRLQAAVPAEPAKTSTLVPLANALIAVLDEKHSAITATPPHRREGVVAAVVEALPKFVYYSNYGNLDSEIYLPHVVQNLQRDDLGAKEAAKARTLRVLFSFVRLRADEILELGRDFEQGKKPSDDELEKIADQKKTRSILLQSAGTELTKKFKEWWQQGDYRFRFEADGNFFRIWVADARRPAEVELENRSTGLQWFLSFYLVFLVESRGEHRNAVLLLDEPGMSLHPLAQRDLSTFFDNLGATNQILYTSHSPFLVDADRLDRARKVYVAADGTTKVTPDLRQSEGSDTQKGAAYAVHSALNLSVAESLLLGCQPVLVEGPSDQHYLTAIKTLLVSGGRIAPKRELVFPPAGGTKTARVVASILSGRDEDLPLMLLDSDKPGRSMAGTLRRELYVEHPERVLELADVAGIEEAEIEDMFPARFLAEELDRMERTPEVPLTDAIKDGKPFVGQVEDWATLQGLVINPHWKVELAIRAKKRALRVGLNHFESDTIDRWVMLFESFTTQ